MLATFAFPYGITTDGVNLYVADEFNNKIRQIVIATGAVTTLAGSGIRGDADNADGLLARFALPWRITHDSGFLFVTDTGNNKIRRIEIGTGQVITWAGPGPGCHVDGCPSGVADGAGSSARFSSFLVGIATDGVSLFVADTFNDKIRQID